MDSQRLVNGVQLATGIAVLVGVGLVVWELQQSRTLARLQLTGDAWSQSTADRRAFLGENFADTFAKACAGSDLTNSERVQILAHLQLRVDLVRRARDMDRVERSRGTSWEQLAEWTLGHYLGIPFGREDYDRNKELFDPALREIADQLIRTGVRPCSETWLLEPSDVPPKRGLMRSS